MLPRKYIMPVISILFSVLACSIPGNIRPPETPTTGAAVPVVLKTPILATVVPIVTEVPTRETPPSTVTETQVQFGIISGHVNYPSEFIPPQRVVVYLVDDFSKYYSVDTAMNQSEYTIQVPAGTYYVVAYLIDGSLSAGYSAAVPCELRVECTNHSLIPLTVTGGETLTDINPFDWYAPEGTFPPKP